MYCERSVEEQISEWDSDNAGKLAELFSREFFSSRISFGISSGFCDRCSGFDHATPGGPETRKDDFLGVCRECFEELKGSANV